MVDIFLRTMMSLELVWFERLSDAFIADCGVENQNKMHQAKRDLAQIGFTVYTYIAVI